MPDGRKNWIPYIVALVIVAVVVVAAVAFVMWPDDDGDKDPLYLHISFNVTTADVPNPTVKIFVDVDGDGSFDQTRTVSPSMTSLGPYHASTIQTVVVQLDENAQLFSYTVEIYNGTEKLFYSADETRTGPIVSGSSDTWSFTPSMESGNCWLVTGYSVTILDENLEMPD